MSTSRRLRLALNTRYPTPPGVADLHSAGAEATGGWEPDKADERWVSTHCAFCGVPCGMHLRVDAGEVVGVEPRLDTHNKGKLCPQGVPAYSPRNNTGRPSCTSTCGERVGQNEKISEGAGSLKI